MNLLQSLTRPTQMRSEFANISLDDWMDAFRLGSFPANINQTLVGNREQMEGTFVGLATGAYRGNGVVFSCMLARLMLFSQARFQWQQLRAGQPGDLFGTADLSILEKPEPGKVTSDLLAKAIVDADLGGNNYYVRRPGRLKRLRPDWTAIVLGSNSERNPNLDPNDVDAEMVGLIYWPGGEGSGNAPMMFDREEVSHFAPIPDPLAHYRGMSWLTPIVREVLSDSAATTHKLKFFENGATPSIIMKTPAVDIKKLREWADYWRQEHEGVSNAHKTMFVGLGVDPMIVGANLQQIDFKVTQAAGETRVVTASGLHAAIVGFSEGLQGSSLNAGNLMAARRLSADKVLYPNWGNLAASLETIVPPPSGARLWYDERHIHFLKEDIKDAAEVQSLQAQSIRTLGDGGWEQDSVVDAIVSGDMRRLRPTGMLSVQLQAPGSGVPEGRSVQALSEFWPMSGRLSGLSVMAGDRFLSTDPVVRSFPSMFTIADSLIIEGTAVEIGGQVRCAGCHRFLAELATPPYRLRCRDCKTVTEAA